MSGNVSNTGEFSVSNGKIYAPNGSLFVANGINVSDGYLANASQILSTFPDINFIRLNISSFQTPSTYQNFVNTMTAAGVVVEFEYHPWPELNPNTGSALSTETNWYASMASYYKSNADVWFGTMNEPQSTTNLSAEEQATYSAIRGTGSNAMLMLDLMGGGDPGTLGTGNGLISSDYSNMTNVAWDYHDYDWSSNYSTSVSTIQSNLQSSISQIQQITGAEGTIPVIVGEYGISTNGSTVDPGGYQLLTAVQQNTQSGGDAGAVAFSWGPGADGLTSSATGGLTTYGQEDLQWSNSAAASSSAFAPLKSSSSGTSSTPASANNTVVKAGSSSSIVDGSGNTWTLSGGVVNENGAAAGYSANVSEIAIVKGTIWQENTAGNWWSWTGTSWTGGSATSPLPVTSASGTVVKAGSSSAITDATGNVWTVSSATVQENGAAAGYSANVAEIAYVGGTVWQENTGGLWWSWNGSTWTGSGTSTSPLSSTSSASATASVAVTPDTISVTAEGSTTTATAPGTVNGDTFSLTNSGVTQATLGTTATSLAFTGTAGVSVTGGAAGSIVSATDGSNTFTVGTGPMDVTGGKGADAYAFGASSKFLIVQDFSATKGDTLSIASSLEASMHAASSAGGTLLSFGDGGAIALTGVTSVPTIHWS